MVVYQQQKLLHLILKCWLSDKDDDLSDEAIEEEKMLIQEVKDALSERDE